MRAGNILCLSHSSNKVVPRSSENFLRGLLEDYQVLACVSVPCFPSTIYIIMVGCWRAGGGARITLSTIREHLSLCEVHRVSSTFLSISNVTSQTVTKLHEIRCNNGILQEKKCLLLVMAFVLLSR